MSLACTHFRLTPEEALRGATQHAAPALGLHDRGQLAVGQRADIAQWRLAHPSELTYWLGGAPAVGPAHRRAPGAPLTRAPVVEAQNDEAPPKRGPSRHGAGGPAR
jgi:imidazolonepropionase